MFTELQTKLSQVSATSFAGAILVLYGVAFLREVVTGYVI